MPSPWDIEWHKCIYVYEKNNRTNDKRTFLKHNTCPTCCSNSFSHTLHIRVMHVSHIYGYIRITCVSYTCMYMLKLRFKCVWPAVHICLTRKRPYRRGSIDGSLETPETVRVSAESYPWSMLCGVFTTNFRTISAWETNKPNGWIPNTNAKNMLAKTRRRIQQQVIVMVGTGNLEFCTSNKYCAKVNKFRILNFNRSIIRCCVAQRSPKNWRTMLPWIQNHEPETCEERWALVDFVVSMFSQCRFLIWKLE